jgi:hypothetical protein
MQKMLAKAGQQVNAGDLIGIADNTVRIDYVKRSVCDAKGI